MAWSRIDVAAELVPLPGDHRADLPVRLEELLLLLQEIFLSSDPGLALRLQNPTVLDAASQAK